MRYKRYADAARRAGVLTLFVVTLGGCWAGYRAPVSNDRPTYGSDILKVGAVDWDLPPEDLDHLLSSTDAGKVLLRSVNAHGGWERWRNLRHVEFRRQRVYERPGEPTREAAGEPDRAGPEASASPSPSPGPAAPESGSPDHGEGREDTRAVVFDPRHWGGVDDEEAALFSLPFVLLRGGYSREYLGVEIDAAQGQEFQKIFFSRTTEKRPALAEELVAYFDSNSGLLKQVLLRQASDGWLLVRMSGWETFAGIRLATRRKAYLLEKMFRRPRADALVWSDTLVDIGIR